MQSVYIMICCNNSSLVCEFTGSPLCLSQEVVEGNDWYSGRAGPWMKTCKKYKMVVVLAKCDSTCEVGL